MTPVAVFVPAGEDYEWPLVPSLPTRFWSKVERGEDSECWLWRAFCNTPGYGMIRNGSRMALAHRVSWVLRHGRVSAGKHILHTCDTPACVNPSHLYEGTNADNIADKVARGRSSFARPDRRGQRHPLAKLSDDQVAEIRSRLTGERGEGRRLAREFGVCPATITGIRQGKRPS